MKGLRNPLLAESILQAKENLAGFSEVQKARILSVHGLYDQIVQTSLSEPPGVGIKRTLSILHGPSIFVAMLFYARGLSRFLKR